MMTLESTGALQPIAWIKHQLGADCVEIPVEGGQTLVLDDWRYGYVTLSDHHELFCVGYQNGQAVGRREHLIRCPAGQLLLGVTPGQGPSARVLVLSGVAGSVVWKVSVAALAKTVRLLPNGPRQVGRLLDSWMSLLIDSLPGPQQPDDCRSVSEGDEIVGPVGRLRGSVGLCWIHPSTMPTTYQGIAVENVPVSVPIWPLGPDTVVTCGEGRVDVLGTAALLAADPSGSFARPFAAFAVTAAGDRLSEAAQRRIERDLASTRAESEFLDASLAALARVGRAERVTLATLAQREDLSRSVAMVHQVLKLDAPKVDASPGSTVAEVGAALERSSGARSRPVLLEGDWWRGPGGPLLGFLNDGADAGAPETALRPVAMVPGGSVYRLFDPQSTAARTVPVDAATAQRIHPQAYQFYRRLPPLRGKFGLARFLAGGNGRDLLLVLVVGLVVGAVGLLIPWITGLIFDRVVPGAERGLLAQIVMVLVATYLGTTLFDIALSFALLRLLTRMDLEAEAATWDHLLRLPLRFFRRFTAGELADRVNGIASIREAVAGATLTSLLSGVFSIWYLGLMLSLDLRLALAALGLVVVAGLLAAVVSVHRLLASRRLTGLDGRLSGLLFQLVSGVAKLRVARAERRGFGMWATLVSQRRSEEVGLEKVANRYSLFQVIYPAVCTGVVFYLLANPDLGEGTPPGAAAATAAMSTGVFLSFFAAFGSLLSASLGLLGAVLQVVAVIPLYERAKPLLDEPPEDAGAGTGTVQLTGHIELSHLSFRYHPDTPLVLDDVSLRIEPGQFVAVVGPSGSGKSTLLRLLLGLEIPSSGYVYYDGQALSSLDVRAVRQQLGVVLQATDIMAGSIFTNIAGSSGATLEQAWQAARLAAFDKDIEAMPMGMHTQLTQGRSSLSGGQEQRLLIARALVRNPKVLLLDEATSALDNQNQAAVIQGLQGLAVTRLVVAHRLSTIQNADRILVLSRGRIVEEGTFQELMGRDGAFRALAGRQLV